MGYWKKSANIPFFVKIVQKLVEGALCHVFVILSNLGAHEMGTRSERDKLRHTIGRIGSHSRRSRKPKASELSSAQASCCARCRCCYAGGSWLLLKVNIVSSEFDLVFILLTLKGLFLHHGSAFQAQ